MPAAHPDFQPRCLVFTIASATAQRLLAESSHDDEILI